MKKVKVEKDLCIACGACMGNAKEVPSSSKMSKKKRQKKNTNALAKSVTAKTANANTNKTAE